MEQKRRRHTLRGSATLDGKMHWSFDRRLAWDDEDEALVLQLSYVKGRGEDRALSTFIQRLGANGVTWLTFRDRRWHLDLDALRRSAPDLTDFPWACGNLDVVPKIIADANGSPHFVVEITERLMIENSPQRIFLSHKGADKGIVREYFAMLKELGFDPWLDEDAMVAGTNLERGLSKGMADSCAAIFFITENYKDEGYLATEVDYAIREKRRKLDRFAIITLTFGTARDSVPELLQPYVWKSPASQFAALKEILRSLPIRLERPVWR